jgi:hypothetical protein
LHFECLEEKRLRLQRETVHGNVGGVPNSLQKILHVLMRSVASGMLRKGLCKHQRYGSKTKRVAASNMLMRVLNSLLSSGNKTMPVAASNMLMRVLNSLLSSENKPMPVAARNMPIIILLAKKATPKHTLGFDTSHHDGARIRKR